MKRTLILGILVLAASPLTSPRVNAADAKWSGVDKTVVEKVAEQAGRPAWKPLINTDQGDLLLLVFLLAGAAGGFVAGYYYRQLFSRKVRE